MFYRSEVSTNRDVHHGEIIGCLSDSVVSASDYSAIDQNGTVLNDQKLKNVVLFKLIGDNLLSEKPSENIENPFIDL